MPSWLLTLNGALICNRVCEVLSVAANGFSSFEIACKLKFFFSIVALMVMFCHS